MIDEKELAENKFYWDIDNRIVKITEITELDSGDGKTVKLISYRSTYVSGVNCAHVNGFLHKINKPLSNEDLLKADLRFIDKSAEWQHYKSLVLASLTAKEVLDLASEWGFIDEKIHRDNVKRSLSTQEVFKLAMEHGLL